MMTKIILIAKPDGYYQEGTEVFNYDGERFTKEEWDALPEHPVLTRGLNQDGRMDGEASCKDEFEVMEDVSSLTRIASS